MTDSGPIRIGVYICHCGSNIAGTVDVNDAVAYAATLPNVVVAREHGYMCSSTGQDAIRHDIAEFGLNRVVVASCSPRLHEPTFRAALAEAGLGLLIEPINRHDVPGFWLDRTALAISVLDEVGADNALVQYDVYHAQRTEGELAATLAAHLPRIGHIQVADNPGRHEPGSGEIHYPFLFAHLDRIGYAGWIGCEYQPAGTTEAGLGWLAQARHAARPFP